MRREGDGQHAARPPEPAQFLRGGLHRVIDGVSLGQFLVERVLAARRQRQCDSRVPGEVTDKVEVVLTERGSMRLACDGDDAEHRAVRNQRHDDRRAFTDVGEALDRVLERIGDQR